jgi:hypothetical protein
MEEGCGMVFQNERSVYQHFGVAHAGRSLAGDIGRCRPLYPFVAFETDEEQRPRSAHQSEVEWEEPRREEREAGERPRPSTAFIRTARPQQSEREAAEQRRMEETSEYRRLRQMELRRRKVELQALTGQGVNIPPLDTNDVRKLQKGLQNLFEQQINRRMEEQQPAADDWDDWEAFEGAYEESIHEIRECIMKGLNRNPARIYGTRQFNAKVQAAREAEATKMYNSQQLKRKLGKLRDLVDHLEPEDDDEAEQRRRQAKTMRRIGELSQMISSDTTHEAFGTTDHQPIWRELNASVERRAHVIEWLEVMITTEVLDQIHVANSNAQVRKIHETYRASKSIAMRRYVDKQYSPPCPIAKDDITAYFRNTWSPPERAFQEPDEESDFFLQGVIPDDISEEMEEFMLNEKNIADVIQSRKDKSATGIDGISYQVFKAVGKAGVQFLKDIISAAIRCGRVMGSWKEARTILLFKKGDQKEPSNWRPITITNCIYRIFTCLMARAVAKMNEEFHVYSDS